MLCLGWIDGDERMTEQETMIRLDFIRCALLGGTNPEIIPNEDNVELMDNAIKALEEIQKYRAIGTPEECREAVEKQKAKKPHKNYEKFSGVWCSCGSYLGVDKPNYCSDCGQKLDLSEEE